MSSIKDLKKASQRHSQKGKRPGNSQLHRELYQDHLQTQEDRIQAKKSRTKSNRAKKKESRDQKLAAVSKLYQLSEEEALEFVNVGGLELIDLAPVLSPQVGSLGPASSPTTRRQRSSTHNAYERFRIQLFDSGLFEHVLSATQARMKSTETTHDNLLKSQGKTPRCKRYICP